MIKAGFGTSDITPSIGIIEPLFAHAMVWQSGKTKGAIISCDLIGVNKEITAETRRIINKMCGIPVENILVCGTHTHSGPTTSDLIGWGEKDFDYLATLPGRIAEAVRQGLTQMGEVEFEYGETKVNGISFNREKKGGEKGSFLYNKENNTHAIL